MSHFTQPGRCFAHEISERLKVIACIEQPNMTHDEDWDKPVSNEIYEKIYKLLNVNENDAVLLFWSPLDDITTALEVIQERCQMAFKGVPKETRKSL